MGAKIHNPTCSSDAASPPAARQVVTVLGTGDYARALGTRLHRHGYDVIHGSRNPGKRPIEGFPVTSVGKSLQASDVIFLAIPAEAQISMVTAHADALRYKVLVDISNPGCAKYKQISHAERLQNVCPAAYVVKAFNTVSAYSLTNSAGVPLTTHVCSDYPTATAAVVTMATKLGIQAEDHGSLRAARELEAMTVTLFLGWGWPTLCMAVNVLYWVTYCEVYVRTVRGFPLSRGPLYTLNKAFACVAVTLLAKCYLPGHCATVLQLARCTKYRAFPRWLDLWMRGRKQLGLYALVFGAMHGCMSVVVYTPAYFRRFYVFTYNNISVGVNDTMKRDIASKLNWEGEMVIFFGVLALTVMCVVGVTSIPAVGALLNWREWRFVQSHVGYACLVLAAVHMIVHGACLGYWRGWYRKENNFRDVMMLASVQASVLPVVTIFLKIVTHLPCVYVSLMRIRGGGHGCGRKDGREEAGVCEGGEAGGKNGMVDRVIAKVYDAEKDYSVMREDRGAVFEGRGTGSGVVRDTYPAQKGHAGGGIVAGGVRQGGVDNPGFQGEAGVEMSRL